MTLHSLRADPEEMTGRARLYLTTCFCYQVILGWFMFREPESFTSTSFQQITDLAPLQVWGTVFILAASLSLVAATAGHERTARIALMFTAGATYAWAGGFLAALNSGDLAGPTAPVGWLTIAVLHTIMASNPIRTPFERIKRRVLGSADRPIRG